MKECSVDDCDSPVKGLGMCQKHYFRMWRNGTLEARPLRVRRGMCQIEDCDKPDAGPEELCHKHLARLKRNGDPHALKGGPPLRWGSDNPAWTDTAVGYGAAHDRVIRRRGAAKTHPCVDCGNPARQWSYDHNDPDELIRPTGYGRGCPFSTKIECYSPRCVLCHKRFDLRYLGKMV